MVGAPRSLREDPGRHAVVNVPPAFEYCSEIFFPPVKRHINYLETLVLLEHLHLSLEKCV